MCKTEFKELGFKRMERIHLTPETDTLYSAYSDIT
jgi:hypothetical protein